MGRVTIVPIPQIIPGIDTSGLISTEFIAQGQIHDHDFGARSRYGLADSTNRIEHTILRRAGTVAQLQGQVLVDLGAGTSRAGLDIALDAGARGYVGVEPHFPRELYQWLTRGDIPVERDILASVSSDDMLTFLQRLPPDSVSLLMAGIDGHILGRPAYERQVAAELVRVLHPDGAYVCDIDHVPPGPGVTNIGDPMIGLDHRKMGIYVKER